MNNLEPGTQNPERKARSPKIIAIWFSFQVLLNVAIALYLALHPPPEPATLFARIDLTVNTGVNAALAVGFWQRRSWAWSTAVVLVPLYWTLHLWHMLVPEEGLLLWPFLLVDAIILAWLLRPPGRRALGAYGNRFRHLAYLPPVMGGLALYAALAPLLGLFVAAPMGVTVVVVGWRRTLKGRAGHGDAETRRRGESHVS